MKEKKKSFVLYADQLEHIELLSDEQAGILMKAIYRYANTQEKPVFDDKCIALAFSFISLQLDRDAEKYAEICERRRLAGQKGGAPLGNKNASKSYKTDNSLKKQAKQHDNDTYYDTETETDTDTDTDTGNVNENEINTSDASASARTPSESANDIFKIPSEEEINAYCTETKKPIDAQAFINYYQSNGWMVGHNPMRNWKAAVRQWRKRDEENGKVYSPVKNNRPDISPYDIDQSTLSLYK